MNIALRILQVLLGLWFITGGMYMSTHFEDLINPWALNAVPGFIWMALGCLETLSGLGLALTGIFTSLPRRVAFISAIILFVISVLGLFIYIAYAGFPGVLWGIIPALFLGFIAYKK